jgi:hypothetical protein
VAVFIVSDGRTKVNPATKHFLDESLGCYDEDVMQITSHGLDVTCHLVLIVGRSNNIIIVGRSNNIILVGRSNNIIIEGRSPVVLTS